MRKGSQEPGLETALPYHAAELYPSSSVSTIPVLELPGNRAWHTDRAAIAASRSLPISKFADNYDLHRTKILGRIWTRRGQYGLLVGRDCSMPHRLSVCASKLYSELSPGTTG